MTQTVVPSIRRFLRANFIAGMFVALPIAITVVFLIWLWNLLDGPLSTIFGFSKVAGGSLERIRDAIESSDYSQLLVPFLGLSILVLAVLVLGILTRSIIGRWVLGLFEGIVARLPFIGILYTSVKQLAQAFFGRDAKIKFQSAVLVQFPLKGSWVIGFVTGNARGPLGVAVAQTYMPTDGDLTTPDPSVLDLLTVFVPTTPLPTQGFTLILPRGETRPLPISVEDAIKMVISGGIVGKTPPTSAMPGDSGTAHPVVMVDSSKDKSVKVG